MNNISSKNFPISFPVLLADIGGTNVRFAILRDMQSELEFCCTVQIADYDNLEHAIREVIYSKISIRIRSAFLAIAASIGDQKSFMLTNYQWIIDPEELISRMQFEDVLLINDFEAQALAICSLSSSDYVPVGRVIEDSSSLFSSRAVVGPGTGLGVSSVIRLKNSWVPISCEGGHMNIGPSSKRDYEIFPHLTDRAEGRLSAEKLLSGKGLLNIYKAICKANGFENKTVVSSEDIVSHSDDPIALEAINLFCEYLGRVAGDLALIFMARGGVYISGGIVYKIIDLLRKSSFRQAFENKAPHKELMRKIPTYVITNPNVAISGMISYIKMADHFNLIFNEGVKRRWIKS
ncbi:glucokinase [Candidatus Liberibacter africanus]|uniref:Glucokinase n=1 Tax=Candidatus Liberibacter africanus PTSAPSY TaxID=1277257 RepID=A0A0G3I1U7_LIBAF|nr:glucokinase [Candidatus Liberibacter africanus]AKK19849.1 glucokinase [Candidatus Liberibacter africanus PTSAPSY]QTP63709.1 glucokinase [Candidatus Liberibacter africanus]